jgi:hypothetical protein
MLISHLPRRFQPRVCGTFGSDWGTPVPARWSDVPSAACTCPTLGTGMPDPFPYRAACWAGSGLMHPCRARRTTIPRRRDSSRTLTGCRGRRYTASDLSRQGSPRSSGLPGLYRRRPTPAPLGTEGTRRFLPGYPRVHLAEPSGTSGATLGYRGTNRAVPPLAPNHAPQGTRGYLRRNRKVPSSCDRGRSHPTLAYFEACFLRLIVAFALRAPAP